MTPAVRRLATAVGFRDPLPDETEPDYRAAVAEAVARAVRTGSTTDALDAIARTFQ